MKFKTTKDLSGQSNLSVKQDFDNSMKAVRNAGDQLKRLPQNPNDRNKSGIKNIDGRMNALGVNAGNDFTMFLLGGIESVAMGAVSSALGITGNAMQAIDVGTSMIAERADAEKATAPIVDKKGFSGFSRRALKPRNVRTRVTPMSMLTNAAKTQQAKAFKNAAPKRQKLEAQLTEAESLAQVMAVYMKDGVYDIYDSPEANGEKAKTKRDGQIRLANGAVDRKYELKTGQKRHYAMPNPGMRLAI